MPIANMASGSGRKLGDTDCTNAQLASLAGGGGFHVVTASSTKPSHVSYIAVDDTGNTTTSMPTNVAPLDGQIYGVAQVVGTPKGASIFFVPSGKTTAQLYRADVDTTATMITPAAPVAGVVVAGQSYEVIFSSYSGVIGVAWYGRTDSPGADANGIHTTTLTP
jgi:hypothetical protein